MAAINNELSKTRQNLILRRDDDIFAQKQLSDILNTQIKKQIKKDQKFYLTKQVEQNRRISNIRKNIAEIKTIRNKLSKEITDIKQVASKNNGESLSVRQVKNGKYLVNVNDKCLTTYGDKDYNLQTCNPNSQSQHFNILHVPDKESFSQHTGIRGTGNIYPFNIVQSSLTKQCVKTDNGNILIQNCDDSDIKMHWNLNPDEKICLDN